LRLGLLIYGSLDTVSGGFLYDRELVAALQQAGDTVEIVSLPWRNYWRHLGDNFSPGFQHQLENLNVDLLIQDELNHPSLFWLNQRLRRRVNFPIISIVHHLRRSEDHPVWIRRVYDWIERRYLNSVDGFVFNSRTTSQTVNQRLLKVRPGVIALPAGNQFQDNPDDLEISQRSRNAGPLKLLFIGNVIRRKGLHLVLQALDRLPVETWQLDIAGNLTIDPGYTAMLRRQARRLKTGAQVNFHGSLSDAELARQLWDSQVLVVPSSYEGYGIVYLEAMSFGVVPLASTSGAAHEIIHHGQDGFLVDPHDAEELAGIIQDLYQDHEKLCRMSLAARQRFVHHPTWAQTTRTIRNFLISFLQDWSSHEKSRA